MAKKHNEDHFSPRVADLMSALTLIFLFISVVYMLQVNKEKEQKDCRHLPYAELLSPREIEVARLASKGLTNAQIADELCISIVTVKRHLATIFKKTGITSRRDLTDINI